MFFSKILFSVNFRENQRKSGIFCMFSIFWKTLHWVFNENLWFSKIFKNKSFEKTFRRQKIIFFYETNFKIKFGSQRSQKSHLAFVCGLEPEFGARCTKNVLETLAKSRFWSRIKKNRQNKVLWWLGKFFAPKTQLLK